MSNDISLPLQKALTLIVYIQTCMPYMSRKPAWIFYLYHRFLHAGTGVAGISFLLKEVFIPCKPWLHWTFFSSWRFSFCPQATLILQSWGRVTWAKDTYWYFWPTYAPISGHGHNHKIIFLPLKEESHQTFGKTHWQDQWVLQDSLARPVSPARPIDKTE